MDPLSSVEAQRVVLEANITKLRKALTHWTTLEAEYEALKDELLALDDDVDEARLVRESLQRSRKLWC